MSERTFRRWRARSEADGEEGLVHLSGDPGRGKKRLQLKGPRARLLDSCATCYFKPSGDSSNDKLTIYELPDLTLTRIFSGSV
ncbi:MAG: helix-turn-helix domain-containing protein [Methylocella sp.]